MIIGQNPRPSDLAVNVCRAKKLTNMRSSNADISVRLTPPTILSLEQSLDFLQDDELLEITPKAFRLRKRLLTQDERAKASKRATLGS
ncbi:MAG: translational GTPase TypA, partial [Thermomicrobiales bacterium]